MLKGNVAFRAQRFRRLPCWVRPWGATGISEAKDINQTGNFDKDGFGQNTFNASVDFKK